MFDRYSGGGEPGPTAVAEFVVQYLQTHKTASRRELNDALVAEWRQVSGRNFEHDPISKLKKALISTQRSGHVRPAAMHGHYAICDDALDGESRFDGAVPSLADEALTRAEVVLGQGAEYVYAIYISAYRQVAEASGEKSWPIKIGRAFDFVARMNAHRTALPDAPVIAVLMRVDDSPRLEKAMHGVLTFRGRSYGGDGGSEWYVTTPEEIQSVYWEIVGDDDTGL